jgi:Leucine-rich repeat (LRR) protein/GTPase SAR1 family protein
VRLVSKIKQKEKPIDSIFLIKGNLTEIRHLRLSRMDLDTLPPEIGFCDKLETIDLTGNPIDSLPETLIECHQLYELKINYKTFYRLLDPYMLQLIDEGKIRSEHIPQVIFELESLRILDLSQTKINSISNEHTLVNLTELYLSNNSFFDIPESICTIEQLKILDMSYNRIRFIPEYFNQMQQLESLNLSFNQLTSLSRILARLSLLRNLNISHNKIERIDREFSQNKSILTLDLSKNKLPDFPNHLCQLKQLETLDLRYNKLESLPSSIRQMIGIKSMNTFADTFHRTGLHLLGNSITNPLGYIWKSTDIQTLFNYIETKEKAVSNNYYYLKLILLGPKNIGKTTLAIKLVNNQTIISNTRKTIDMYVSILQDKQLKTKQFEQHQRQASSEATLSTSTDQWIENRISTSGDYQYDHRLKTKRVYPPPIKTYRSTETSDCILQKSIIITKNNFYLTIFDLANEPSYEILYPLIYDSNALYILPINLTILLNILQAAISLDNLDE